MQPPLILASLLLAFAAYWSVRLSYADWFFRQNTPASVARAAALDPANSRYQAWLAERQESEGQDPSSALDEAARLNPFDSRAWIRRGLNAELTGNMPEAERLLLHAASIDKLMEPRWTLMNFYFRRGNSHEFWRWAKEAFAISYGDRTALFELCWRVKPDPALIASHDYAVLKQLLNFLVIKHQLRDAAALAMRILPEGPLEDRGLFTYCLDRLIEDGDTDQAVGLWNALWPDRKLEPDRGRSLTNPGFATFPSSMGFDWRLPTNPEVRAIKMPDGLRLFLSGKQPGSCRLLSQTVPVTPGHSYRLRFSSLTAARGIRAYVGNESSPDLFSSDWRGQDITFDSGPHSLATLAFDYRRLPGYVPAEGSLTLRAFSLELRE